MAKGIPHGIIHFSIPAWMAMNGNTNGNIPLDEQVRVNGLMWGSKTNGTKFCWMKVSATQFNICMVITNLGFSVGPAMISTVKDRWGWKVTILFFAIILSRALILLQIMMSKIYEQQLDVIKE
jgi:hypothetical protein